MRGTRAQATRVFRTAKHTFMAHLGSAMLCAVCKSAGAGKKPFGMRVENRTLLAKGAPSSQDAGPGAGAQNTMFGHVMSSLQLFNGKAAQNMSGKDQFACKDCRERVEAFMTMPTFVAKLGPLFRHNKAVICVCCLHFAYFSAGVSVADALTSCLDSLIRYGSSEVLLDSIAFGNSLAPVCPTPGPAMGYALQLLNRLHPPPAPIIFSATSGMYGTHGNQAPEHPHH